MSRDGDPSVAAHSGRWIRPLSKRGKGAVSRTPLGGGSGNVSYDSDDWAGAVLDETRRRVHGLTSLARRLEDDIRGRWEESEEAVKKRREHFEAELDAAKRDAESEAQEARRRAENEGRAEGFREGFARGREEGYRLGLEEGRREGVQEGERSGREEGARQTRERVKSAASALVDATARLEEESQRLYGTARRELVRVAVEIARKIIKREVEAVDDIALANVRQAVELIFRRGALTIQVNTADAPSIQSALNADSRWGEGFETVEIVPVSDVARGGCRLLSGPGSVDMTTETQLSLIESALARATLTPRAMPAGPSASGRSGPEREGSQELRAGEEP